MRLIDADALLEKINYKTESGMGKTIAFTFKHFIDEAPTVEPTDTDLIRRADAIEAIASRDETDGTVKVFTGREVNEILSALPSADAVPHSEQYKKGFEDAKRAFELEFAREAESIRKRNAQLEVMLNVQKELSADAETDGDMGEVSDGYHTFNQLYHQRAVLFATIVKQNKEKAWKSWKHGDGKFCFDSNKEWFIVGVDTPEGSYTYHYEKKCWDMFDCIELEHGKFWDGHTEEDVTRLLSIPSAEAVQGEWEHWGSPFSDESEVIDTIVCSVCGARFIEPKDEPKGEYNYCPNCGARMKGGEDE